MTTFVYVAFDADRQPLYVGCTSDVERRLAEHARLSGWPSEAEQLLITEFPTRDEALAAETERIASLRPRHNRRDNPRHKSLRKAVADHAAYEAWLATELRAS